MRTTAAIRSTGRIPAGMIPLMRFALHAWIQFGSIDWLHPAFRCVGLLRSFQCIRYPQRSRATLQRMSWDEHVSKQVLSHKTISDCFISGLHPDYQYAWNKTEVPAADIKPIVAAVNTPSSGVKVNGESYIFIGSDESEKSTSGFATHHFKKGPKGVILVVTKTLCVFGKYDSCPPGAAMATMAGFGKWLADSGY